MNTIKPITIDNYTQDILDWIIDNLYEQPRLDDLAKKLGYSKRMIQLHFKKTHGMTIGDYIHNRRLYRACVLLRMTTLPVCEIAYALHYDNHHNFCRAFKKKLHCTPKTFRNLPLNLLPSLPVPKIHYNDDFTYQIITLENKTLYGVHFQYEEKFTAAGVLGEPVRIQRLQGGFQDSHATITIASEVDRNNPTLQARNDMIIVDAIIGYSINPLLQRGLPESYYTLDGVYLCCPFYGTFSEYAAHNKDIYMHLLDRLGLKRREGRDVEFFHFTPQIFDESPKILCEHCIPIIDKNDIEQNQNITW